MRWIRLIGFCFFLACHSPVGKIPPPANTPTVRKDDAPRTGADSAERYDPNNASGEIHDTLSPVAGANIPATASSPSPRIVHGDTLTVRKRSAIMFQPDSGWIGRRLNDPDRDTFRMGADDYMYSLHMSEQYLDSMKLTPVDASGYRYIRFVRTDKKQHLIRLDTMADRWGIFLFEPSKPPLAADMTTIEEDYAGYFN